MNPSNNDPTAESSQQVLPTTTTATTTVSAKKRSPSEFLKSVLGRPICVKLNSGIEYRGVLASLDGYLNIAMEQTEEYYDGQLKSKYGDCFIRGNNDDGKYCFTGGTDRSIRLWNPSRLDPAYPSRTPAASLNDANLIGVDRDIESIPRALPIQSYSDGISYPISAVATGATDDISSASGQQQQTYVLSGSGNVVVLHDVVTGQCVRRFQGHVGRINDVTFSSGAETYISASYDATVRIWDGRNRSSKANSEPIQTLKDAKDSVTIVKTIQNSSNTLICTASVDGTIRTYDLRKGVIRCDFCDSPIIGMAITNDGTNVAASCLDGTIRLLDCHTGDLVNTYHSSHASGNYALNCCITSNDCTVVTGSENGEVIMYDLVRAQTEQRLTGHTGPTCAIACHPSRSDVVVSASYDTNNIVWANELNFMSMI